LINNCAEAIILLGKPVFREADDHQFIMQCRIMIQDKEIKMGRPLNKKFFGAPGSGYEVVCLADVGAGSVTSYIVEQRSNSKYRVAEVATPANTAICKLVDATPAATGEMQVLVTPENAVTPLQATVTFTAAGGTGALATVAIAEAGYGYWTAGTNVAIGGTSDGTIDYTVANGSLATVSINTAGTANTNATVDIADAPAANPPTQSARIINAHQVKTFEGNTYVWPTNSPLGGARGDYPEADIGS
jgi:hypothetical protein